MGRISRQTKQKQLLEEASRGFAHSFSVEDLYEVVSKKDSSLGIATVYRFLKDCRKKGTLFSYTCEGKAIYSNKKISHCHFVCEKTGKIIHFDVDSLDFIKDKIPGSISSFQIEVKGVCDDCQ